MTPRTARRPISILSAGLVLGASALPASILAVACDPMPQTAPPPSPASSGTGQTPAASAQSWSQLGAYLNSFCCTDQILPEEATREAFILANESGPGAPLYTLSNGLSTTTTQLIASATKMPAAAAILSALYKSKKYTVTTPVGTILAEYGQQALGQQWSTMEAKFGGTQIEIGQLLSMTSGLATLRPGDPVPPCMDGTKTGIDPNDKNDVYTQYTLAQCVSQIADPQYLVFKPGTQFGYSSASYQVAGYLATLIAGHPGDWLTFFDDTIVKPLGLQTYSYDNDLYIILNPFNRSPPVTNPRIAGGAASSAYDYSTILTMILNGGSHQADAGAPKVPVLSSTVVNLLEHTALPPSFLYDPNAPDEGLNQASIWYLPRPATAADIRGYSYGLFIPTSVGLAPGSIPGDADAGDAGFFDSLTHTALPTSPKGNTPLPQDLTLPHTSGSTFLDPGEFGTVAWLNTDPASRFSAVNVIYQYPADTQFVGLDMARVANSAIACQFLHPGPQPYPSPNAAYHPPFCRP